MIKFQFIDTSITSDVALTVSTQAGHLPAVIEAFKDFLMHAGYHPDSVNAIISLGDDSRQGFRRGDGNPLQGDFFDESREPDAGELGDDEPWEHGG